MGKLVCDSSTTIQALPWREAIPTSIETADLEVKTTWETVSGLEEQQKRYLQRLYTKGVLWKHPIVVGDSSPNRSTIFRLAHGGDVEADGNCLFTASQKAMKLMDIDARELRRRTVNRFLENLRSGNNGLEREWIDSVTKHLYSPDLKAGWGVHVVQEVKLLAKKTDRVNLDVAINEHVDFGLRRETAAETIYKERCIMVNYGLSWGNYKSISGSPQDEYDIITLQHTEGLLSVDENREGHAAAFGDDIAIERGN
ncbi:Serine protease [Thalictrum thalictroides]|uniref:Serine protease n=1 Tax=Thalictrum thalictroides TaxID=46969 RepID=A0A7J6WYC1_THATH|nr:Serine protease [Thalictrum thalictroides]